MKNQELFLSSDNLNAIKEEIQLNLLKRGITAPIIKIEETLSHNNYSHYIKFETAEFQTTPVMFKKLTVSAFGSGVNKKPKSELSEGTEGEYISVWICVNYSYEAFNGGTNFTDLFNIWFNVFDESEYNVKLVAVR